jgi:RNA polymerase sigma-70 factor (ECF subfamily)
MMQTSVCQSDRIHAVVPQSAGIEYLSSPLAALSDEKLIDRCRHNDRAAFDVLIKRYERPIYYLALRLSGNYDDAHDVAAETFVRIYRRIGTFQCSIALPAWINRIVINLFKDTRRYSLCRPAVSLNAMLAETGDTFYAEESPTTLSPQSQAEENERRTMLNEAIDALPDVQCRMMRLFHHENHSYEEIANLMRIPVGTVKSRLHRARLALREILAPHLSALMN